MFWQGWWDLHFRSFQKISHHGRLHENHSSAGPRHTTERGEEEGKLVVRIDWIKNQQVDRNLQHFQNLDS